jgi:hypothetical protein
MNYYEKLLVNSDQCSSQLVMCEGCNICGYRVVFLE